MSNGRLPRLEPMDFGMLLDRSFRLYFSNFAQLLGVVAVIYVPFAAIQLAFQAMVSGETFFRADSPPDMAAPVLMYIAMLLWLIFGIPLATGAAAFGISRRYLGESFSLGQAYGRAFSRFFSLVGANLLVWLMVFGILMGCMMPGMVLTIAGGECLGMVVFGLGALVGMVLFLFLWISYIALIPSIVVEGRRAFDGLRRGWRLVSGNRWKAFGVMVLLYLAQIITQTVATMAVWAFSGADGLDGMARFSLVGSVVESTVQLLFTPLLIVAPVLIYYDLRIRKEGFDLEMLSQAMGLAAPIPVVPVVPLAGAGFGGYGTGYAQPPGADRPGPSQQSAPPLWPPGQGGA